MIYDGTSVHLNGEASTDRQVGTSQFNSTYTDICIWDICILIEKPMGLEPHQ